MGILSGASKSIVAGAKPEIEAIIDHALSDGKQTAAQVVDDIMGHLDASVDRRVNQIVQVVESVMARVENLVGFAGATVEGKKLKITVECELVPKK